MFRVDAAVAHARISRGVSSGVSDDVLHHMCAGSSAVKTAHRNVLMVWLTCTACMVRLHGVARDAHHAIALRALIVVECHLEDMTSRALGKSIRSSRCWWPRINSQSHSAVV